MGAEHYNDISPRAPATRQALATEDTARLLLPGLEYLAREARGADLSEIARILEGATSDVRACIQRMETD
jgi:hypothetical protein